MARNPTAAASQAHNLHRGCVKLQMKSPSGGSLCALGGWVGGVRVEVGRVGGEREEREGAQRESID